MSASSGQNRKSTLSGTSARSSDAPGCAGRSPRSGPGPTRPGSSAAARSTNSSTGSIRMYSPLNAASFLTSKNAGEWVTSSSRNSASISRPRHDLAAGRLGARRGPAERHQVVDHRLGEVALVAVLLERHLVAPLRQLLALLVDQHRHVRPRRRLVAERLPQHLLLRRVRQVLLGADDVGDAPSRCRRRRWRAGTPASRCRAASTKSSIVALSNVTSPRTRSWTTVLAVGHPEPQHAPGPGPEPAVTRVAVVAGAAQRLRTLLDLLGGQVAVVGDALRRTAAARRRRARRRTRSGSRDPRSADRRPRCRSRPARR